MIDQPSGILVRLLSTSIRRPKMVLIFSVLFLLLISGFVGFIKLGSTVEPTMLPKSMQSYQAFAELKKGFPDLAGSDFSVILEGENLGSLDDDGELQAFLDDLAGHSIVQGPLKTELSEDQKVLRYQFMAIASANSTASINLIHDLRERIFPKYLAELGVVGSLSGTLPYVIDDRDRYWDRTPLVFAVVTGLSFLFLLVAFRSVVVPFKAMLLNLLSTAASFGLLVLFFQFSGISFWNYGVIESFIPPLLFSILFGLSMDYHVFLLSRVSEEFQANPDIKLAVANGIKRTSKTITGAALIMVSVFLIIGSLELPIMRELGIGLALAVLLDATLIRSALLPASLVLLGKWNWYLPRWLRWLPRIRLD